MFSLTRHDFELLCAAAALAGLRNPRQDQYSAQVQSRAQTIADEYERRGFFKIGDDGQTPPARFADGQTAPGVKRPPVVMVGQGKPGEGVAGKKAIVVNQTAGMPGRPPPATVNQNMQKGSSMTSHQSKVDSAPRPRIVEPRNAPPTMVVGGPPQPKLTEPEG